MRVTGKKKVRASTTTKSDSPATNKKEEEGCVRVKSNQASLELRKRNSISTGPSRWYFPETVNGCAISAR
ncbi:hypothetical protein DY000_02059098 [Brassica cretica]|uniref:Uncharacterized protein n=1 Tax=Brassica cretica TaxID=69181 RepID=A0ABQ7ATL8_BRACR|nr:hypothetical protein DY000_02059098 [Brassica cretica]